MPEETQTAPAATTAQPDIAAALQRLVERQGGDAGRVAELLFRENHDLRERNRQLAAQAPAQGAVVLAPEQAAQWTAYTALGKAEELQAALEARQAAEQRLASLEREATLRQVAEASGYKASVLARLADGLALELRDNAPVVVVEGRATPLAEYAEREWAEFLPALAAQGTDKGTAYVRQAVQGGAPANPVDAFIEQTNQRRAAVTNPLLRK